MAADLRALSFPASYLELAERKLGSGYEAALREAGLRRESLSRPDVRIDGVALRSLLAACVARCSPARPPSIELLESASLALHGLVGLLSMTADSLGAALDAFLPFLPQLMPAVRMVRRDLRGAVELRAELTADFGELAPMMLEMFLGGFLQILPFAASPELGHVFAFAHPARWPLPVYQAYFGPRVSFGAPADTVRFERSLLARKLVTRSPATHAQVRDTLQLSEAAPPHSARVKRQIERALDERSTVEPSAIARALAMSPRTLSRRLQDEGTTLASLVGEVRIARAAWLLAEGGSVGEVAERVGYRDATSFARAFKRARGTSPRAARRER